MTLFGSPAILALPAGFHTMTTKIWSLFQYPPKPELAAAASLPLLLAHHRPAARAGGRARPARLHGGRAARAAPPRLVRLGRWRWPALALCLAVLCLPVFLPYGALLNAAFSRIPSQPLTLDDLHAAQLQLRVLRAVRHPARHEEHVPAGRDGRHLRHAAGAGDRLSHRARGRARPPRAGLPRHGADRHSRHRAGRRPVPRLHARADRALRHAVDPAARLPHDRAAGRLPAAAVGLPLAVARAGGGRAASSAPRGCARCATSPRRCSAPA